jgi:hypothetical protein
LLGEDSFDDSEADDKESKDSPNGIIKLNFCKKECDEKQGKSKNKNLLNSDLSSNNFFFDDELKEINEY